MLILILVVNALFGLSFTIGKMLLGHAAPLFLVSTRMIISGIFLTGYSYINNKLIFPPKTIFNLYAKQAIFGVFGFYALRAWALNFVSSSVAATIFSFFPLSTAIVSWYVKGLTYSINQILGLIIGCLGITYIITKGTFALSFGFYEFLIILSVFCLSIGFLTSQDLVKVHNNSPLTINGLTMLFGGILTLITSFLLEPVWISGNVKTLILLFIAQIILSNFICANLQTYLLGKYSATDLAFASFLSPLSTFVFGAILLKEPFSLNTLICLAVISAGFMLYNSGSKQKASKSVL